MRSIRRTIEFWIVRLDLSREAIGRDHAPNLLYLIGFCFSTTRLQVEDFRDTILSEDVVSATRPLNEAKMQQ